MKDGSCIIISIVSDDASDDASNDALVWGLGSGICYLSCILQPKLLWIALPIRNTDDTFLVAFGRVLTKICIWPSISPAMCQVVGIVLFSKCKLLHGS